MRIVSPNKAFINKKPAVKVKGTISMICVSQKESKPLFFIVVWSEETTGNLPDPAKLC